MDTHGHKSHSRPHSSNNTYLLSRNKSDARVRVTRIGLYVNLGMVVSKGFGGYLFKSHALLADTIHSLTDLVSDVLTLATVGWSLKPASHRFPNGYGKIESLGALGVSIILLSGGFLIGWEALVVLCRQLFPEAARIAAHWGLFPHSHENDYSAEDLDPNTNAMWLTVGSIFIKEWLYHTTLKVAKEHQSAILASNACHHRMDSLTECVTLLLITATNFLNSAQWLDPTGGLVISVMVIQAGWGNVKQAVFELADVGIDAEMERNVRQIVTAAIDEIAAASKQINIGAIQGTKAGQNYLIDMELGVPEIWTVSQVHGIEELVRERVSTKVSRVKRVRICFISNITDRLNFSDEFYL